MAGTALVRKELKASGTVAVATNYYPSSSGFDLSQVRDQRTISLWVTNAGDASSTVDYSVEYSRDGTNWFTGPPTYGLDVFAQVTSAAVKFVRKPSVVANFLRVKEIVAVATSGASDIQLTHDGGDGSFSA